MPWADHLPVFPFDQRGCDIEVRKEQGGREECRVRGGCSCGVHGVIWGSCEWGEWGSEGRDQEYADQFVT